MAQDKPPSAPKYNPKFEAGDAYLGAVPISPHRVILVYRRMHLSRRYVRLRVWNLHKTKLVWYPQKRHFVAPLIAVKALGEMIYYARESQPGTKPDWLKAHECGIDEQLWALRDKGVSDEDIEARQREIEGKGHYESFLPLLLEDELAGAGSGE